MMDIQVFMVMVNYILSHTQEFIALLPLEIILIMLLLIILMQQEPDLHQFMQH